MLKTCVKCSRLFMRNRGSDIFNHIEHKFASTSHTVLSTHTSSDISAIPADPRSGIAPTLRSLPCITGRKLQYLPANVTAKQAWLETLDTIDDDKLGIVDLHPEIFATFPRIDVLWWNIHWQNIYRQVNYDFAPNRAELKGGGRKPWQQKGSGRARHGSIRSPLWHGGGKTFGPRGPKSYFFMLDTQKRVLGLRVALSVKYAQDNLHIVESLDLPSDEPEYLQELIESRGWGLSVLFVDDVDIISRNIVLASDKIPQYNILPVYGLNVYSILKHETLVMTLSAVEKVEEKLLYQMNKKDRKDRKFNRTTAHLKAQPGARLGL